MTFEDLAAVDADGLVLEGTVEIHGHTFEVHAVRITHDEVDGSLDTFDPENEIAAEEFEAFWAYVEKRSNPEAPNAIEIPGFEGEWLLWIVPGFSP